MKKVADIIIFEDEKFYCAFPTVICKHDGELVVAFRIAPDRRFSGATVISHADPDSCLVLVRSRDCGANWSEPELIFRHPLGGCQDPCLALLNDGAILCTSYAWYLLEQDEKLKHPAMIRYGNFASLGGFILRSNDGGKTWLDPTKMPPLPESAIVDAFAHPCPALNRGTIVENDDGTLLWSAISLDSVEPNRTSIRLLASSDKGVTWEQRSIIAEAPDGAVNFNETSLYQTADGDLVAFIRSFGLHGHLVTARSKDGGNSFEHWEDAGFRGHPFHPLRLPDGRVLLTYGYRHEPYGIRARILEPECRNPAKAKEIIVREDGGNADIGYPWSTLMPDGHILVVYYFNDADGPRYIAGTILQI